MDFFEKIFQKISQHEVFAKSEGPGLVRASEILKYLEIFANTMVNDSVPVQPVASRSYIGRYGDQLFLPEKIEYFEDRELNKSLYKNLILQIMSAHQLDIFSATELGSPIIQRLKFLESSYIINLFLDKAFPGYVTFQSDLLSKVQAKALPRMTIQRRLFDYWKEQSLARESSALPAPPLIDKYRMNDRVPEFLFLTVPCIQRDKERIKWLEEKHESTKRNKSQIETEKEKTYSGIDESVDLEKEKANPVMHSFEKLETADEYEGGRRAESGDDDLNDQSNALDELNLSKVTRGGEAAKSAYSAETTMEVEARDSLRKGPTGNGHFFYSEWNVKKNIYMRNHCHLIENPEEIEAGQSHFKETLLTKNRFQIRRWQGRIQALVSEPIWRKKLKEGDEIDVDEVIRDLGGMRSGCEVSARWYMNRRKLWTDVEIIILFDQSHSSDSWICNRRVLDITLESVGTAGLLFDKVFQAVTVAGVWSSTRHNCGFQIYKDSGDPWSVFYHKAEMIEAQGYTRLGPAIRHSVSKLRESTHKKKLILLFTDGKPTDVDGYEGIAGVGDVAQACREAETNGILHYALILDFKQKAHFAKMFKNYSLLHDPKMLSEELFKILFRLINL